MNLCRALRIRRKEVVSLVGGGGKTSAMFRLGDELADQGWRVVCTTSTHISADQVAQAAHASILPDDPNRHSLDRLRNQLTRRSPTLLVGEVAPETGKAKGLSPGFIDEVAALPEVDAVINEADGARTLPFKAPAEHEPVIPSRTTLVVPTVGIDAVGQPLADAYIHRPDQVAALTGAKLGQPVTAEHIAAVLIHPDGGLKNVPARARVVALINKVENEDQARVADRLADQILGSVSFEAVAIGAVRRDEAIQRVRSRVAAVVLAAGESRRFGQLKQLLPWGDEGATLLTQAVDVAVASRARPVIVVLGCQAETCRSVLTAWSDAHESVPGSAPLDGCGPDPSESRSLRVVVNPDWAAGQSTSVRAGLAALPGNAGAALFHLADQPGVTPKVIDALIARYAETLAPVVWPEYQGRRGNPVLFDRLAFPQLRELTGDVGGRPVLKAFAQKGQTERVPVDEPGVLLDIDTLDDLART
jgi:molybdenum cofactor cytidylyltransferase